VGLGGFMVEKEALVSNSINTLAMDHPIDEVFSNSSEMVMEVSKGERISLGLNLPPLFSMSKQLTWLGPGGLNMNKEWSLLNKDKESALAFTEGDANSLSAKDSIYLVGLAGCCIDRNSVPCSKLM
jgi:hypothetical protein